MRCYPSPEKGELISHVYISDDPFGLDFGEEKHYVDSSGKTYPIESRTVTSFEVLDAKDVPPEALSTPAPTASP